ncbi:hypothetical protein ACEWY4_012414 [Coilia grayii]|uniref:PDZ domain-containing protein n=1 Tax=Coilia grayii TaxID=363190 RepID=A0ABD1K0G1_9TELE
MCLGAGAIGPNRVTTGSGPGIIIIIITAGQDSSPIAQTAHKGRPGPLHNGPPWIFRGISVSICSFNLSIATALGLGLCFVDFVSIQAGSKVGGGGGAKWSLKVSRRLSETGSSHTMALTVTLLGPSPWGFRISGGRDFKKAITVSKVNGGSKAEKADLQPGDIILEINGESTGDMLNVEAQNKIKSSQNQLQLLVERPDPPSPVQTNGITTPDQLLGRFQEAVQVSRDENQNYREYTISSPASLSPGPYSPEPPPSPDRKTERITPTNTKSPQLRSWSPEEKNLNHRLSRPLSQVAKRSREAQDLPPRTLLELFLPRRIAGEEF